MQPEQISRALSRILQIANAKGLVKGGEVSPQASSGEERGLGSTVWVG